MTVLGDRGHIELTQDRSFCVVDFVLNLLHSLSIHYELVHRNHIENPVAQVIGGTANLFC
jgi:hypothetical protein